MELSRFYWGHFIGDLRSNTILVCVIVCYFGVCSGHSSNQPAMCQSIQNLYFLSYLVETNWSTTFMKLKTQHQPKGLNVGLKAIKVLCQLTKSNDNCRSDNDSCCLFFHPLLHHHSLGKYKLFIHYGLRTELCSAAGFEYLNFQFHSHFISKVGVCLSCQYLPMPNCAPNFWIVRACVGVHEIGRPEKHWLAKDGN
ncbi:hypothetical protein BLOT_000061 [Blomia tropicalis]|nr:hypothetical protein BLOT_000061 [Blomia tropicalis]